jgi:hypothetical protein
MLLVIVHNSCMCEREAGAGAKHRSHVLCSALHVGRHAQPGLSQAGAADALSM